MSVSGLRNRGSILALGFIAAATIAACDSHPTQPSQPFSPTRVQRQPAAFDGDTLACGTHGWTVIQGFYVCNEA